MGAQLLADALQAVAAQDLAVNRGLGGEQLAVYRGQGVAGYAEVVTKLQGWRRARSGADVHGYTLHWISLSLLEPGQ
jgi:hypothetical protein